MNRAVSRRNGAVSEVNGAIRRLNGAVSRLNETVAPLKGAVTRLTSGIAPLTGAVARLNRPFPRYADAEEQGRSTGGEVLPWRRMNKEAEYRSKCVEGEKLFSLKLPLFSLPLTCLGELQRLLTPT